ncbi:MAG: non-canonical purine NTP pyrophosphatase, partial [Betaproteobacteria bacterium]|nr:non-canonical purine NTP pyrophosphatase [Betaproteobacteria bacterium]
MAAVPSEGRAASFVCVLVAVRSAKDPLPLIAQGRWKGLIATAPQGEQGFGYDPVFWDSRMGCTAAQMSLDQKNGLSHRGQAARSLLAQWRAHE